MGRGATWRVYPWVCLRFSHWFPDAILLDFPEGTAGFLKRFLISLGASWIWKPTCQPGHLGPGTSIITALPTHNLKPRFINCHVHQPMCWGFCWGFVFLWGGAYCSCWQNLMAHLCDVLWMVIPFKPLVFRTSQLIIGIYLVYHYYLIQEWKSKRQDFYFQNISLVTLRVGSRQDQEKLKIKNIKGSQIKNPERTFRLCRVECLWVQDRVKKS